MSIRTGKEAIAWAVKESANESRNWQGLCLMFVRSCFNVAARYPSAETGYYNTTKRHTSWPPPAGVPVWWTNGRYGHIAISTGDGYCWSTDWLRPGQVDRAPIRSITTQWGQNYRGWTEDINGVTVWSPPPPSLPKLNAANIARAARKSESPPQGLLLKKAVAKEVGRGVMSLKNGKLGAGFRRRYKLVQKKYLGSRGVPVSDRGADGIPGKASLTWLGKRHGFNVE